MKSERKPLRDLGIPFCQQMFVKWKSFKEKRPVEGCRGRARKQAKCNLEMEGECLDSLRICALRVRGQRMRLIFYIVHMQSPSRGVPHQDQDLNNVALPLSRRHTLQKTCWNWLSVSYSQWTETQTDPSHSSATSLRLEICSDSSIHCCYIPWLVGNQHLFNTGLPIDHSCIPFSNKMAVKFCDNPEMPTLTFSYDKTSNNARISEINCSEMGRYNLPFALCTNSGKRTLVKDLHFIGLELSHLIKLTVTMYATQGQRGDWEIGWCHTRVTLKSTFSLRFH